VTDVNFAGILPRPIAENGYVPLEKREATFLLGTDYYIGYPEFPEQRVAITPQHCKVLGDWLDKLGVRLNLKVVAGAGKGARFEDSEYVAAGAQIIAEDELGKLDAPDVVHALKEPSKLEEDIQGPYLRIGALHTGDFRDDCGLAKVLKRRQYSGIFDGSAVGGFAYNYDFEYKPKFLIPLRSSMSVYAGKLAGEDTGEVLVADEKVVVAGGGIVGTAAIDVLLTKYREKISKLLITEYSNRRCQELREMYAAYGDLVEVKKAGTVTAEDVQDAKGLILTIFIQGSGATPRVIDVADLGVMRKGGIVVDVAIDEGGGIRIPKHNTGEMVEAEDVKAEIDALKLDLGYVADNHMPRRRPRSASEEHSVTSIPYIATMLYLCARENGPEGALTHIMDKSYIVRPRTVLDAMELDLKQGMAFVNMSDITVLYRHLNKKSNEISEFLKKYQISNVFA
jgi:alanine dehydrogenase